MRRGVEMATKAAQANDRRQPHFMPTKERLHWELPLILPAPDGYVVDHGEPVNVRDSRRAIVTKRDPKGKATAWLGVSKKGANTRAWYCALCIRKAIAQGDPINFRTCRRTKFACKVCRRFLCKDTCWHSWHDNLLCPSLAFTTPAASAGRAAASISASAPPSANPPAAIPASSRAARVQARSAAHSPASKGISKETQQQLRRRRPIKQRTQYACNRDATKSAAQTAPATTAAAAAKAAKEKKKAADAKTAEARAAAADAKAAKEKKKAEKAAWFKRSSKPAQRKRRREDGTDECEPARSKSARRR